MIDEGITQGQLDLLIVHRAFRLNGQEEVYNALIRDTIPSIHPYIYRLSQTTTQHNYLNNPLCISLNQHVSHSSKVKAHLMIENEYDLASTLHGVNGSLFKVPNVASSIDLEKKKKKKNPNQQQQQQLVLKSKYKQQQHYQETLKPINIHDLDSNIDDKMLKIQASDLKELKCLEIKKKL